MSGVKASNNQSFIQLYRWVFRPIGRIHPDECSPSAVKIPNTHAKSPETHRTWCIWSGIVHWLRANTFSKASWFGSIMVFIWHKHTLKNYGQMWRWLDANGRDFMGCQWIFGKNLVLSWAHHLFLLNVECFEHIFFSFGLSHRDASGNITSGFERKDTYTQFSYILKWKHFVDRSSMRYKQTVWLLSKW